MVWDSATELKSFHYAQENLKLLLQALEKKNITTVGHLAQALKPWEDVRVEDFLPMFEKGEKIFYIASDSKPYLFRNARILAMLAGFDVSSDLTDAHHLPQASSYEIEEMHRKPYEKILAEATPKQEEKFDVGLLLAINNLPTRPGTAPSQAPSPFDQFYAEAPGRRRDYFERLLQP